MKHSTLFILLTSAFLALAAMMLLGSQPTLAGQGSVRTDKIEPALLSAMQANPNGKFAVVVQSVAPDWKPLLQQATPSVGQAQQVQQLRQVNLNRSRQVMDRILKLGGEHVNSLAGIGASSATLSAKMIGELSLFPPVKYVRLDRKLVPLGTPGSAALSLYTQLVHAPDVWNQGYDGRGIGVAILDSGVAPEDDLMLPTARVVASVDFAEAVPPGGDPGGHGTHVAGIVGGNGTDSAGQRIGIAPGVNLINVRVIGSNGSAQLSAVIRGIMWVVQNRKQYNIRVLNVSLGATSTVSYVDDPLASAVEMAWASGITVVTAAGNAGPGPGTIVTPGLDPFVVTVGALDDAGTLDTSLQSIATFSSLGPTPDGLHKPDLVAPGRKIVSLRVPGSYLDVLLPDRITDQFYFRLSGTSMASPVVAGTAALMLQKNGRLTPNQVKSILTQTAHPVPGGTLDSAGTGLVDAFAAVNSPVRYGANRGLTPSNEFCTAVLPILKGMPLTGIWRDPNYKGINWANITWDNITWDRTTWENITWENITWDNISWTNITWDNITWDSGTWDTAGSAESAGWDAAGSLD